MYFLLASDQAFPSQLFACRLMNCVCCYVTVQKNDTFTCGTDNGFVVGDLKVCDCLSYDIVAC